MLNIYCASINHCALKCKHVYGVLQIITARVVTADNRSTGVRAFEQ
jgi:hypothetical protein